MPATGRLPPVEQRIDLVEKILRPWHSDLGNDLRPYRNHVYRVIHFSLALRVSDDEERRKVIIATCFHDLGIWSGQTFDYLPPSLAAARDYLRQNGLDQWSAEVELMIDQHHKLRPFRDNRFPLVELLRRADLIDVSLGIRRFGLPRGYVKQVRQTFPNAGFHERLVRLVWDGLRHRPLNPLPFYKW